jgi:hypothetical protein
MNNWIRIPACSAAPTFRRIDDCARPDCLHGRNKATHRGKICYSSHVVPMNRVGDPSAMEILKMRRWRGDESGEVLIVLGAPELILDSGKFVVELEACFSGPA